MKHYLVALWAAALALTIPTAGLTVYAETSEAQEESSVVAYDEAESSQEVEYFQSGDFAYTLKDDGTALVTRCMTEETEVVVPAQLDGITVTELDSGAFSAQDTIVTLTLPETLETLNESCFYGCNSLEEFIVADGNESFVAQDGVLYSADGRYLYAYPAGREDTSYTIADGVIEIWSSAFANAPLTSVAFPHGLLYIDDWSFAYTPLTSLELPDTLLEIGNDTFIYCNGLTEVVFPASLEIIGAESFAACENLAHIQLQEGLLTIKMNAFAGTAMTEVTIPSSVTAIGFCAFGYEADTVTPVEGFVVYGTVGSQAQTYCTDSDEENDYENHFTFRSVMSESVDVATGSVDLEDPTSNVVVEAQEKEESFWQKYGTFIFIAVAAVMALGVGGVGVALFWSARKPKEQKPESPTDNDSDNDNNNSNNNDNSQEDQS